MSVPEIARSSPAASPPAGRIAARPWLTYAFIATFALIFCGEAMLPAGPGSSFDPTIQTLVAWGGMSRTLIIERGDWFRLLTAAFLHGGIAHLAMNSLAMAIAGSTLEPFIGRAWFAALFFIGALTGGLASVSFNPPNIVGVGASGAILALFGFFLTIAFRFEKGPVRRAFVINSLGTLIPSTAPALLPAITGGGFSIDYAAHAGGAVGGAALGLLFVAIWRRDQPVPPWRPLAIVIIATSLAVLAFGALELRQGFKEQAFIGSLMPDERQPRSDEDARRQADDLIRDYPNDPRGYFYKALQLADRDDFAGMETNAARATELAERYTGVFRPRFRYRARMLHALALKQTRRIDEARTVAKPLCGQADDPDVQNRLRRADLC